jgi:nitronate monooxygenase
MFKTRITELFGIRYPIIGGCMQYISGPDFVAEICNAGALGVMSSAMFFTPEDFRGALRRLRELTDKPFAVNLNLFPALRPIDNELYVEIILEEGGVRIVETSGKRPPEELYSRLKENGIKVMHKCTTPRHALVAQDAGADAVTLFGYEGGGHIGTYGLATFPLVPLAAEKLRIPVIAAGGVVSGRGLLAALALGAEGVTIGTRLLLTDECPIHLNLKHALLEATEFDTLPILGSVHNPIRAWKNEAALKAAELESEGADFGEILKVVAGTRAENMFRQGDIRQGIIACSQSVGLIREIKPVARVIEDMAKEAEAVLKKLSTGT